MSNYPAALDNNDNLYLVHDALRVRLVEDYNPGDTSIAVEGSFMSRFPNVGIITLTEQCSDIDYRALSFFYTGKTDTTFTGLQLLPCFVDVPKPKRLTDVTQNVMAEHHNTIKDALIAIENFVGVKGEISAVPLKGTMEARINFLRHLVLKPKSWFTATKRVGVIPLCIQFKDFSTRQPDVWIWDFGDGSMSTISRTGTMTGDVSKCYYSPGIYDVSLTVENEFGVNTVTIYDYVNARVQAPDAAEITFIPAAGQISDGTSIRARVNTLISMLVSSNGQQPLDPITSYTWNLSDDLNHDSSDQAVASYSIGGLYDVRLRADTELGAYRQTVFPNVIDIVESYSLWHFIFDASAPDAATTKNVFGYEFGLIDESYKVSTVSTSVTRNSSFLAGVDDEERQVREFRRNNGFSPVSLVTSGDHGHSLVYWAEGAATPADSQVIRFREYDAFAQTWITPVLGTGDDTISRRWNWLSLGSASSVYFLLGNTTSAGSLTNQNLTSFALSNYAVSSSVFSNYQNGADELKINVGGGSDGDFSVYRGTWRDSSGFFVRNDGTGPFFRLKSFYATEGTVSSPLQVIRKLTDMPGSTKFEGQMVPLANGVYFFNNTGEVLVYNPVTNVWATGGPGVNSPVFSKLQDTTVPGYDNPANTLIACGDQDHRAYLSYDYSTRAMLKFNEVDLTFTTLPVRPSGEQFVMGIY